METQESISGWQIPDTIRTQPVSPKRHAAEDTATKVFKFRLVAF